MAKFKLNAEKRSEQGKGASRRLRRDGKLPAIIYGGGKEPTAITLNHAQVLRQLEDEGFYSQVITVDLEGALEPVILRDLQRHPAKPFILHLDLQRINENEAIRVHIPLHFINEDHCVGAKSGGQLIHQLVEVGIAALPKNLPEYIEVDVAELGVGESLHLSDLTLPEGVELPELAQGGEHDLSVVTVQKVKGAGAEAEEAE